MKKLLPPILFLLFTVLMAGVCWVLDSPHKLSYPYNLFGSILLISGLGISIFHSRLFKKVGANIMTFGEPTQLIKEGLYKYSRNPMYLGFVLALLGLAFLLQAAISSFVFVTVFWFITDRWYIRFEEKEMVRKFGEEYKIYCEQTPRWLGIKI